MKRRKAGESAARQEFLHGRALAGEPPLDAIAHDAAIHFDDEYHQVGPKGWLALAPDGTIWVHPKRQATPREWARVLALAYVSLGFGLVRQREPQALWEIASLLIAERFCHEIGIGATPESLLHPAIDLPAQGEEALFGLLTADGCDATLLTWREALCGKAKTVFCAPDPNRMRYRNPPDWKALLAEGISRSAGQAIERAGGWIAAPTGLTRPPTAAEKARRRLTSYYPLLGALAVDFTLSEDRRLCQLHDIQVAAIDVSNRTILINPTAGLNADECLFVLTHELLHAGLNHASRRRGRDPFLWNAACDFVINGWLIEMGIGEPPKLGLLHDPELAGCSAEE
ncbi:MAG: hypothetical protein KDJ31_19280, partial [Candidatus Competibacteraceae bacterium]|nr:hypothetical protein [Candidatus Competibacteraceae bacterium]